MPAPDRILRTIQRAIDATRATPGRKGRFIELADASEVLVAGDLHGNVGNFQAILKITNLGENPRRHLVLQEVIHGPSRYADGSDRSHQMLDLFAALKVQYPERVHLLMGNHELSQWTNRKIAKNDEDVNALFRAGVHSAYGAQGTYAHEILAEYDRLFTVLPLAVRTPNRVFLSHSLPSARRGDAFDLALLERDQFTEKDLLPGGGVYSLVWGRDAARETAEAFLQKVNADWLISGHIACEKGYAVPNPRQIVLDSADHPAACCLFPADRPLTQPDLLAGIQIL